MNFWDQNYAAAGYRYGEAPNSFLVEQSSRFPSQADVLVPGDGEGRNGVWLAQQGHRVISVDSSLVGLEKARSLAERKGVKIETLQADLAAWSPQAGTVDVVVLTFVHLQPSIRSDIHRRLADALRPGGLVVLEAFHPLQLNYSSGGPLAQDMLYSLSSLRTDFLGLLDERLAWEGETHLDEGHGHQGSAFVTRWVGQR